MDTGASPPPSVDGTPVSSPTRQIASAAEYRASRSHGSRPFLSKVGFASDATSATQLRRTTQHPSMKEPNCAHVKVELGKLIAGRNEDHYSTVLDTSIQLMGRSIRATKPTSASGNNGSLPLCNLQAASQQQCQHS